MIPWRSKRGVPLTSTSTQTISPTPMSVSRKPPPGPRGTPRSGRTTPRGPPTIIIQVPSGQKIVRVPPTPRVTSQPVASPQKANETIKASVQEKNEKVDELLKTGKENLAPVPYKDPAPKAKKKTHRKHRRSCSENLYRSHSLPFQAYLEPTGARLGHSDDEYYLTTNEEGQLHHRTRSEQNLRRTRTESHSRSAWDSSSDSDSCVSKRTPRPKRVKKGLRQKSASLRDLSVSIDNAQLGHNRSYTCGERNIHNTSQLGFKTGTENTNKKSARRPTARLENVEFKHARSTMPVNTDSLDSPKRHKIRRDSVGSGKRRSLPQTPEPRPQSSLHSPNPEQPKLKHQSDPTCMSPKQETLRTRFKHQPDPTCFSPKQDTEQTKPKHHTYPSCMSPKQETSRTKLKHQPDPTCLSPKLDTSQTSEHTKHNRSVTEPHYVKKSIKQGSHIMPMSSSTPRAAATVRPTVREGATSDARNSGADRKEQKLDPHALLKDCNQVTNNGNINQQQDPGCHGQTQNNGSTSQTQNAGHHSQDQPIPVKIIIKESRRRKNNPKRPKSGGASGTAKAGRPKSGKRRRPPIGKYSRGGANELTDARYLQFTWALCLM